MSASGSGSRARVDALVVDVRRIGAPDLAIVDGLARLVLDAHRAGRRVLIEGASAELRELLDLAGLSEALDRDRRRRTVDTPRRRRFSRSAAGARTAGRTAPCPGRR